MRWELLGYSTEEHGENAVRHREYTTSAAKAALFARIPRVDFTDSGHGIVFCAEESSGPRKKRQPRMEHVQVCMAQLRAEESRTTRPEVGADGCGCGAHLHGGSHSTGCAAYRAGGST